ncbi:MAG: hypothetical protein JNL82_35265 [Myxococcales bacterium]|nr:hypothetical protein [Myxococcales bacterium]
MTTPVTNPMRLRRPEEFFAEPARAAAAAIQRGDTPRLKAALAADPRLVATVGAHDMTLLLWAMALQEVAAVEVLLAHGADPDHVHGEGPRKYQPLALAAGGDNDAVFDLLLLAGADPNSVDGEDSALFNAIHARRWDRVAVLLDAGADIDRHGPMSSPPVIYLAKINEYAAVADFIERGADIRARDLGGATLADVVRTFKLSRDSPNGQAHARVERMLVSRGAMPPRG